MIERILNRLQAAKPKPGDTLPSGGRPTPALGQTSRAPAPNVDTHYSDNQLMKRSGSPTLGLGHDWRGMPQRAMELRSYGESVVDLGAVSGAVVIDVDSANVFIMQPGADVTLTFDTTGIPDGYGRGGLDVSFSVLIENDGGHTIEIAADHWAPLSEAPTMNRVGFYEINVAIAVLPDRQIVRAFPCIQPAEA